MDGGPYLVKDLEHLQNRNGPLEVKAVMALCRCGQSANKPFCDGTHAKIGFDSEKLDDRVPDKLDNYEGDGVTVHDNRGICAHAGYCTRGLPPAFGQEPFVDPTGASAEEIMATIKKCPSGALSYSVDGAHQQDPETDAAIFVAPNGPYVVGGGPELIETEFGEGASTGHYTLCRCGGSKNKPFCDGTHHSIEFKDDKN